MSATNPNRSRCDENEYSAPMRGGVAGILSQVVLLVITEMSSTILYPFACDE